MNITMKRAGRKYEKIRGVKSVITARDENRNWFSVLRGYHGEELVIAPEEIIFVESETRGL